jgi:hypothetical protein
MRRKISDSRNKFEDLIQMAKNSEQGMEFLYSSLANLAEPLQNIIPSATVINKMSLKHSLVAKSHKKWRYIHQMISTLEGDAKELKRARRRRHQKNGCVENVIN